MTLSRDERRELHAIDHVLSREAQLASLATLFAQSPRPRPPASAGMPVVADARGVHRAVAISLVVAMIALTGVCVLASLDRPMTTVLAAVLAVSTGLGLARVLAGETRSTRRR
jgi:hypothetical protein